GVKDPNAIVELSKVAAERGIRIDVYGIGDDYDYALCKGISDASAGTMRHAVTAKDLDSLSRTSVDKYKSTIIDKVRLRVVPANGAEIENAAVVYPQVRELGNGGNYDLGSLSASPIFVAVKLKVHGRSPGVSRVMELSVNGVDNGVDVNFVQDESWIPEDCGPRMYYLYADKVLEMQRRIGAGEDAGDVERTLHELLATQCSVQLQRTDLYFMQMVQISGQARSAGDQRTKIDRYSTMVG
ncbi:MAG: hypothetical protein ACP5UD_09960, partial [Conexivisphaera sp.]